MKFSEIEREQWKELAPYLDTVLLPVSGLTGGEEPWEAVSALERLRDALDPLETAYRGRVVTYPALHYVNSDDELVKWTDELCDRLFAVGFQFCIVVTGDEKVAGLRFERPSAVIGPAGDELYAQQAKRMVESLWHGAPLSIPENGKPKL